MYAVFVFFFLLKRKTAYEMRISDWSSDVCSSDLGKIGHGDEPGAAGADHQRAGADAGHQHGGIGDHLGQHRGDQMLPDTGGRAEQIDQEDRKSVVEGTSVSVRVALGGRRIIKKK